MTVGDHVSRLMARIMELETTVEECDAWFTHYRVFGDHGEMPLPLERTRRALRRTMATNAKGEGHGKR